MYVLCASGTVNTQVFVWKFLCTMWIFVHLFIHTQIAIPVVTCKSTACLCVMSWCLFLLQSSLTLLLQLAPILLLILLSLLSSFFVSDPVFNLQRTQWVQVLFWVRLFPSFTASSYSFWNFVWFAVHDICIKKITTKCIWWAFTPVVDFEEIIYGFGENFLNGLVWGDLF